MSRRTISKDCDSCGTAIIVAPRAAAEGVPRVIVVDTFAWEPRRLVDAIKFLLGDGDHGAAVARANEFASHYRHLCARPQEPAA